MRIFRLVKALLVPALLLILLCGCSITQAMRVENREVVDVKTMIDELRGSPLVFVGERHDAPAHHDLQLDILKAIKAEGKPVAIGMEMFEESSQRAIDAWTAGKVPEEAFRKVFAWNWRNLPWDLYRDLLIYARDNRIPVVALNAPRDVVAAVAKRGFASLTPEQLRQLPEGTDASVNDEYLKFMMSFYPMHGRQGDAFRNIGEAQMLRNKVMARRISDYMKLHPDTVMVVIAGGGHARENGGVPAELKELSYKIVLPPIPGLTSETVTTKDANYLLVEPFFSW
ncbi:MAG TPA: hypothetical protein DCZ75_01685 [Geobacter sp.]|nr:hypothetical protein [Geobacter sp.]